MRFYLESNWSIHFIVGPHSYQNSEMDKLQPYKLGKKWSSLAIWALPILS